MHGTNRTWTSLTPNCWMSSVKTPCVAMHCNLITQKSKPMFKLVREARRTHSMDSKLTGSLSMVVQDSAIAWLLQAHAPHSMQTASASLVTTTRKDSKRYVFSLEGRKTLLETFRAASMQSDGAFPIQFASKSTMRLRNALCQLLQYVGININTAPWPPPQLCCQCAAIA